MNLFTFAYCLGTVSVVLLGVLGFLFGTSWLTIRFLDYLFRFFRVNAALWEFLVLYLGQNAEERAEYKRRKAEGQKLTWRLVREDGTDSVQP